MVANLSLPPVAPNSNDKHHRTVYTGDTLNLWLAHRCDFYGAILVLAVSCFAVGMKVGGFLACTWLRAVIRLTFWSSCY
jgi:hypothetical protein